MRFPGIHIHIRLSGMLNEHPRQLSKSVWPRTVNALAKAIKLFKGGTIVVTHNKDFLQDTCDEIWNVEDGRVAIEGARKGAQKLLICATMHVISFKPCICISLLYEFQLIKSSGGLPFRVFLALDLPRQGRCVEEPGGEERPGEGREGQGEDGSREGEGGEGCHGTLRSRACARSIS